MYLDRYGPREGFLKFRQEFNRQTKEALARRSESYELFESFTLIPPLLCSLILKLMPVAVRELVGSVGVSIINKADVFIAPFSDVHTDGFIAISNFFTPTEDGDIGCYVSIKGPRDTIERYLAAIEEIAMAQTVEREASSERRKVAPGIPNFLEGRNLSEIAP
jgi:hypothetical protein